jgi:hypothetical protein
MPVKRGPGGYWEVLRDPAPSETSGNRPKVAPELYNKGLSNAARLRGEEVKSCPANRGDYRVRAQRGDVSIPSSDAVYIGASTGAAARLTHGST